MKRKDQELEELVGELQRDRARPQFRAQLRATFLAGCPEGAPAEHGSARRPRSLRWAPLLALAAAALLIWVFRPGAAAESWEQGTAERFLPALAALRAGEIFEATDCDLELALPSGLVVRLCRGGRLQFLATEPDGGDAVPGLRLLEGELLVRGPAGYDGPRVQVNTDQLGVLLGQAGLSILAGPDGTCVCVAQGRAELLALADAGAPLALGAVEAGHTWFEFASGRPSYRGALGLDGGVHGSPEAEAGHLAPLLAFLEGAPS